MGIVKQYIIIFNEHTVLDNIIISVKQDINRPNNPTDDEIIAEYIYNNYEHINYEINELDTLEEISL